MIITAKAITGLSNSAEMVGERHPFLPEILSQIDPPPSKTAASNQYPLVVPKP